MLESLKIATPDENLRNAVQHAIDFKTKPPGSLGRIEPLALQIAMAQGTLTPKADPAHLLIFAGDHVIKHLEQRLERAMALMEGEGISKLALVGGVAANMELRRRLEMLCERREWSMVVPPPRLCTDQGAMSAWAAVERIKVGSSDDPADQEVHARYPFSYKNQEPS